VTEERGNPWAQKESASAPAGAGEAHGTVHPIREIGDSEGSVDASRVPTGTPHLSGMFQGFRSFLPSSLATFLLTLQVVEPSIR
jgi:hypothetical protein